MRASLIFSLATGIAASWAVIWDPAAMQRLAAIPPVMARWSCVGARWVRAMRSLDQATGMRLGDTRTPPSAASYWTANMNYQGEQGLLKKWYWFESAPLIMDPFASILAWSPFLHDQNVNDASGFAYQCYKHADPMSPTQIKDQRYQASTEDSFYTGAPRHATGAEIEFMISRQHQMILVNYFQPVDAAARVTWHPRGQFDEAMPPIDKYFLPHLHALSDLLWIRWTQGIPGSDYPTIKYIGFSGITNAIHISIIARILLDKQVPDLEPWPVVHSKIPLDSDAGQAFMASKPAQIVAHLLMQRKAEMGRKHIKSFIICRGPMQGPGRYLPNLIIEIEDVPANLEDNVIPPMPDPYPDPTFPLKRRSGLMTDHVNGSTKPMHNDDKHLLTEHIIYT